MAEMTMLHIKLPHSQNVGSNDGHIENILNKNYLPTVWEDSDKYFFQKVLSINSVFILGLCE